MWSRLRRKTMAPRRPVLYSAQYALAAVAVLALAGGLVFALLTVLN